MNTIFCFLLLLASVTSAYAENVVRSNLELSSDIWKIDDEDISLNSFYTVFTTKAPSVQDILSLKFDPGRQFEKENFGKHSITFARITNVTSVDKTIYFINFIRSKSRFFILKGQSLEEISRVPFRFDAVKISIKPGDNYFVMSNFNDIMNLRPVVFGVTFLDEKGFNSKVYLENNAYGAIYGIAFLLIFYSLFSFVVWKKRYFFYYTMYGATSAFIFTMIGGYLLFDTNKIYVASFLHAAFVMLFINEVLSIKEKSPGLLKAMYLVCCLILAHGVYTYFFLKDPFTFLSIGFLPVSYMLIASIVRYRQGYRPALLFISGFLAFAIGASIATIDSLYFNNSTLGLPALIGWVIELGLFTFAVGLKLKRSEMEALNQSFHAFEQLSKIVYPHQIRQIKDGVALEATMPVHQAEACVISFDLIESSKIDHLKAKEFLRNLFRRCNEAMIETYDGSTLISNAFRIKEMGDGFLCSVGYPFKSPSDNAANDAIKLSYRFVEILNEESALLELSEPICCGVGIAIGSLQGFYPEGGTVEYDIYGQALILATRYERLRKVLRSSNSASSMIICQKRVITSASPHLRSKFQELNMEDMKLTVRDDPSAKQVYIQNIGSDIGYKQPASRLHLKLVD